MKHQVLVVYPHKCTGCRMCVDSCVRDCIKMDADRINSLERLFNIREGLSRKDDTLPRRLLKEAMPTGPSQDNIVPLARMLDEYYELMDWDADGVPTGERMRVLGLEEEWEAANKESAK